MALLRFAFAIALALFPLSAQVLQTLDLSAKHGRKAFYVVLASRGGSSTGHAFVVWGIEDGAKPTAPTAPRWFIPFQVQDE
jgi:hypothetical protein